MATAIFNKWTQYLRRDILLEFLTRHRHVEFMPNRIIYAIVRNPNFDLARYSAAFPNIEWKLFMGGEASVNDIKLLIELYNPNGTLPICPTARSGRKAAEIINKITESQIREIDKMGFDVIVEHMLAYSSDMVIFAGRPDISIDIIARMIEHLDEPTDINFNILAEMADRKDLTPEIAKQIYDIISRYINLIDVFDGANTVARRLASNPALSIDDLYSISKHMPELMLNQTFEPQHLEDPRFDGFAVGHVNAFTAGNCNFPRQLMPRAPMLFMNPQITGVIDLDELKSTDLCMTYVKNQYTRHPVWRAKCQRREAALNVWLQLVWRGLSCRLPTVLVEMILDTWYTPYEYNV